MGYVAKWAVDGKVERSMEVSVDYLIMLDRISSCGFLADMVSGAGINSVGALVVL